MPEAGWGAEAEALARRVRRYRLLLGGVPLSCEEVLDLWQRDTSFRDHFSGLLRNAPFATYRWETPPLTRAGLSRDFEFVLLDSPELDLPADPMPFMNQFAASDDEPVIGFASLGGDAHLIVPCPRAGASAYRHLAAFVRDGPAVQQHALWRSVGAAMCERLAERPLWLSTAGGGVAWLHVRLDTRPKYYGHRPYAAVSTSDSKGQR